ncbi:hypothetical protein QBC34DRAFT_408549 [Podospora aff. communis PSN243]|uniref:histidine kinase n=1 Tax=Podospora aff. communis PSN243 TaxID=3040156 RepID=A0AAV9GJS8_9PEZI|nr:hypothetical protein QBC34DRAFT_408549 [Podospora aff. communis PSN243]
MSTASFLPVTEPARERETFKYDNLGISTAALRYATAETFAHKDIPTSVLSSTPDPCLTAFAQLGLYRVDATQCIVSLFDRTYQHFVAEVIRCRPRRDTAGSEQVVYCGTAKPRADSLCEHVLTGPPELASIPGTTDGAAPENLPVSVIRDLDKDPLLCHKREKNQRFYAGVPIRSPTGVNIGVYCTIDSKPRPDGLTKDQIQFVRDISKAVMDYLETKRSSEWYRRGERMVRGLGSFVEGQATLSNWSDNPNKSFFKDLPGVKEGALNKRLQEVPAAELSPGLVSGTSSPAIGGGGGFWAGEGTGSFSKESTTSEKGTSGLTSAAQLQADVERVFSKASNVIREAVEVEGVVFLDASVRAFGARIGKEVSEPPILTRVQSSHSSSDEGGPTATAGNESADHSTCKVLGFSTSSNSSINGDALPPHYADIPQKFLRRLLQRYHHGHIFNFETDGSILDFFSPEIEDVSPYSPWPRTTYFGDSEELPKQQQLPQKVRKRRDIASTLQKMFPGAKSVAFIPLFDGQKNRWFAGGFVWTKTPTRIFTVENELSYLRVFALTAMAEVARLNTRSADKTKTDILGSISHELRSPLHGVVGAVELLRSTSLDRAQENMLRTIETSGRTLLDTIDHLLDYSRISNQIRAKSDRRGSLFHRGQSRNISPTQQIPNCPDVNVHLDRLAEEVVESVLAGWSYRNRSDVHFAAWSNFIRDSSSPGIDDATKRRQSQGHLSQSTKPVQVLLDIEPGNDWSFRTHPGAFRRTVMNLLGNSLKFTKDGFIRVKLFQRRDAGCGRDPTTRTAVLSVSDSGKGIGEEYLKHQLFTPFSQEDPFAPGTGLGLSLVRQMVISLGGNIDVQSSAGHGTTVTVSVPLPRPQGAEEEEPIFDQNVEELKGSRVLLQGLDAAAPLREGFGRDEKEKSQLELVEEMCRHWLRMEVVTEANWSPAQRLDFVISSHGHTADDKLIKLTELAHCPHVFIRQDPSVLNHRCAAGKEAYYLMPPVGPRKLADALVASRLRFEEAVHSGVPSDANGNLTPAVTPPYSRSPMTLSHPTSPTEHRHRPLRMTITVEPRSPGRPDTPLAPTPRPSLTALPPVPEKNATAFGETGPSILIVDDNAINLKILSHFLRKLHIPHSQALNGLEALEMYTKAPTDFKCILTDISMPVMDGLESTRRIREFEIDNKLDPVTVFALTGLSGQDTQEEAFVSGVDVFLTKPLDIKNLTQALEGAGLMPRKCEAVQ